MSLVLGCHHRYGSRVNSLQTACALPHMQGEDDWVAVQALALADDVDELRAALADTLADRDTHERHSRYTILSISAQGTPG